MSQELHIRDLITRLARLDAATAWSGDLNPTQRAVLDYLGRANRFSRSPSHVAEYLGSTRGTVSQSLKSLSQKGYVTERRSTLDKRAISIELTAKGHAIARVDTPLTDVLSATPTEENDALLAALSRVLSDMLARNNGRAFGICKTCKYNNTTSDGGYCTLLSEPLLPVETTQICFEQESA
ncbi:MAG: MarR family winged helix-turn-helix transcriptional regulator [Sulfitobacter sp.]